MTASAPWTRLRALASEGARLGLLSLLSLGLGYLLTLAFLGMGLIAEAAFGLAVTLCSILNFLGCRHYVFRGPKPPAWQEAIRFFPSVLAFRAAEVWLFSVLNTALGSPHLAYFATAAIGMAAKLLVSRLFIFRRRPPTRPS